MGDFEWSRVESPQLRKEQLARSVLMELVLQTHQSLRPRIALAIFERTLTDLGYETFRTDTVLYVSRRTKQNMHTAEVSLASIGFRDNDFADMSLLSLKNTYSLLMRDILVKQHIKPDNLLNKRWDKFLRAARERVRQEINAYGDFVLLAGDAAQPYRGFDSPSFNAASNRVPDTTYLKSLELGNAALGPTDAEKLLDYRRLYDLGQRSIPAASVLDKFFSGLYLANLVKSKGLSLVGNVRDEHPVLTNHELEKLCISCGTAAIRNAGATPQIDVTRSAYVPKSELV